MPSVGKSSHNACFSVTARKKLTHVLPAASRSCCESCCRASCLPSSAHASDLLPPKWSIFAKIGPSLHLPPVCVSSFLQFPYPSVYLIMLSNMPAVLSSFVLSEVSKQVASSPLENTLRHGPVFFTNDFQCFLLAFAGSGTSLQVPAEPHEDGYWPIKSLKAATWVTALKTWPAARQVWCKNTESCLDVLINHWQIFFEMVSLPCTSPDTFM